MLYDSRVSFNINPHILFNFLTTLHVSINEGDIILWALTFLTLHTVLNYYLITYTYLKEILKFTFAGNVDSKKLKVAIVLK